MNKQEAIKNYNEWINRNNMYKYAINSISYDDETGAPKKAYKERSEVMNFFGMELFKRSVCPEFQKIISDLDRHYKSLSKEYKRIVDLEREDLKKNIKVPENVMFDYQKATTDAYYYWELAKNKSDYSIYKPYLKKVVETQIELGKYIKEDNEDIYDTFLKNYEEGISQKELDIFFDTLKARIVPLLQKIVESDVKIDDSWAFKKIDHDSQMNMGIFMAKAIGYDFSKGMVRETEHPFTNEISDHDVRITTHIYEDNFTSNLFSMAHEGGHGVYGQNINQKLNGTILKDGASMAFHESQSRFFENIVGRSESFSKYVFPQLVKLANKKLDKVTFEQYYQAINKVTPSLIRTEADELTYCLHVMVRYELEKLMMHNEVDYDTLNELWNKKYKEYLGVDVPSDKEGILQDVHWTSGCGYFFSYALGNAYSAQIYHAMKKDLDVDALLEKGDIKPIIKWLKAKMYKYGRLLQPKELIVAVTGEPLNVNYYCEYLEEKYSKIYHL